MTNNNPIVKALYKNEKTDYSIYGVKFHSLVLKTIPFFQSITHKNSHDYFPFEITVEGIEFFKKWLYQQTLDENISIGIAKTIYNLSSYFNIPNFLIDTKNLIQKMIDTNKNPSQILDLINCGANFSTIPKIKYSPTELKINSTNSVERHLYALSLIKEEKFSVALSVLLNNWIDNKNTQSLVKLASFYIYSFDELSTRIKTYLRKQFLKVYPSFTNQGFTNEDFTHKPCYISSVDVSLMKGPIFTFVHNYELYETLMHRSKDPYTVRSFLEKLKVSVIKHKHLPTLGFIKYVTSQKQKIRFGLGEEIIKILEEVKDSKNEDFIYFTAETLPHNYMMHLDNWNYSKSIPSLLTLYKKGMLTGNLDAYAKMYIHRLEFSDFSLGLDLIDNNMLEETIKTLESL